MAITKVSRGLISTSIVDNGNATAITIDSSENVSFTGAATFSGNLGIGTDSPTAALDVKGSTSDQLRLRTADTEHYALGRNASTGFLDFYGSQASYAGYTFGGVDGERMRIDSSGNVGIGTNSPTHLLQISGGASDGRISFTNNARGNGQADGMWVGVDSTQSYLLSRGAFPLTFYTNATERMRIDASGNLTLNTTNSTLNVGNGGFSQTNYGLLGLNGSNGGFIKMGTAGVEQGAVYANSGGLTFQTPATYGMTWYPAGAFAMKLDASGKILIGGSASQTADLLQIETPASGGGTGIQIRRADSNADQGVGRIQFGNNTATDLASISAKTDGATDNGALLFNTSVSGGANTERMRISSAGAVTMPYQPRFLAYGASSGYVSGTFSQSVIFPTVANTSGHYSTSTGLFTAPVTGTYLFQGSIYSTTPANWAQAWLTINGARGSYTDVVSGSASIVSTTHLVDLTAGDTVGYHPYADGGTYSIVASTYHTYFKGRLLG